MKKVKQVKGFGIYEASEKEQKEQNISKFVVFTPDEMELHDTRMMTPDWDCETLQEAVDFVKSYND